ncbi:MAG: site-specific integrase [Erysipelotrichia bacterium]|nr:site-specific integrase [Erysipelotrichia bacterium]
MKDNELFKHAKFVKQIKSEKTGKWSFKVFIPYKKDFKSMTYTKTFNETNYLNPRQAYLEAIVCRDQFLLTQKTIGAPNYSNLTVNDTLEKYFLMTNLSHETIRKKRLTFSKWVNKELLEKNIRDVSAADIQFSLANASRQENISQGILDYLVCIWTQVFKAAIRMDIIVKNPCDKIEKIHINKVKSKRIAETNLETLLKVCDGLISTAREAPKNKYNAHIMSYALKVSWFTALRPAEVLALEYSHIDFDKKLLYARQEIGLNAERKSYIRGVKTQKSYRDIPLTDPALELFKEIMNYQKDKKYLFADYNGNLLNSTIVSDRIMRLCKKENIQFNWYCLRHQYSTDMQRNNENISVTAKGMGHENINVTYQYTRMSNDDLREAMNRLNRKLTK